MKTANEIWISRNPTPIGENEKDFIKAALMCMEEYAAQFRDLSDYHRGWNDCLEAMGLNKKGERINE